VTLHVTVDKNDLVEGVRKDPPGREWRFKRVVKFRSGTRRTLSLEQEQEICATYVDQPNVTTRKIAEKFGISESGVISVVRAYGLPKRRPPKRLKIDASGLKPVPNPPAPRAGDSYVFSAQLPKIMVPPDSPLLAPDPRPVWQVTLVRRVTEKVRAESLLDIAAVYDGQDAEIVRVEKLP
jgi:hypothetical protein